MSWNLLLWSQAFWATTLLLICSLFVLVLVPVLVAALAGMSSPRDALYFRMSVEAIPVGHHHLVLVDVSSPSTQAPARVALGRLSHSAMYNSPGAIRAVIEAIAGFEAVRATASQNEA